MKNKPGFTLIEIMASLVVFSVVMATMAGVFYRTVKDSQRQRDYSLVMENARWAIEFMSNKIMTGEANVTVTDAAEGTLSDHALLKFTYDTTHGGKSPDEKIYFWRGDGTTGEEYVLYYGLVSSKKDLSEAEKVNVRKELCRFVVDGTDIFTVSGCASDNCTVALNLTVRLKPDQPEGQGNRNYNFRTMIRPRN